jgi:DNA polymerase-3 subunit delta'
MGRLSLEKQKGFLSYMLKAMRENFMITVGAGSRVIQSPAEKSFSEKFHPYINDRNIFTLAEEAERAHYHLTRNGRAKIIFMDMALSIMQVIKS